MRIETPESELRREPKDLEPGPQPSSPRKYSISDKVMLSAPSNAGSEWGKYNYKRGEVADYGAGNIPGHPELGHVWIYSIKVEGRKEPEEWPEPWLVKVE